MIRTLALTLLALSALDLEAQSSTETEQLAPLLADIGTAPWLHENFEPLASGEEPQTFVVPQGVHVIVVAGCGAGGGGGGGAPRGAHRGRGGGGGAGGEVRAATIPVTSCQMVEIRVPAGAPGGAAGQPGQDGRPAALLLTSARDARCLGLAAAGDPAPEIPPERIPGVAEWLFPGGSGGQGATVATTKETQSAGGVGGRAPGAPAGGGAGSNGQSRGRHSGGARGAEGQAGGGGAAGIDGPGGAGGAEATVGANAPAHCAGGGGGGGRNNRGNPGRGGDGGGGWLEVWYPDVQEARRALAEQIRDVLALDVTRDAQAQLNRLEQRRSELCEQVRRLRELEGKQRSQLGLPVDEEEPTDDPC